MSQGEEFERRLQIAEREETDAALRKLTDNIEYQNIQRNEIQLLSRLPEYRYKVDNLSIDLAEV
jgi:hypothetical protein